MVSLRSSLERTTAQPRRWSLDPGVPFAPPDTSPYNRRTNQTISGQVLRMIGGRQDRSDGAVNSSTGHGP